MSPVISRLAAGQVQAYDFAAGQVTTAAFTVAEPEPDSYTRDGTAEFLALASR